MAGTVRGVFDLNARPATSALRRVREESDRVDASLIRTGKSMDRVATVRQAERLERYETRLAALKREALETAGAVELLQGRLDRLGRTRVSPQIDLDGISAAMAQVTLLEARLAALGQRRVTPTVAARAGAPSMPGARRGGFFGGGAGGGGRDSFGIRSINLGPVNLGRAGAPFLAAVGLPAARGLIGGAAGLAGSVGMGALGAGAIGVAGGGALTSAIGSIASVAAPAASAISGASDALTAFQEAVQTTGRNSREAREAQRLYNAALKEAPRGTQAFLSARERLSRRWQRATQPAQEDFTAIGTLGMRTLTRMTPQLSRQANRFFGAAQPQAQAFSRFLQGDRTSRFIETMGESAAENLGEMERTLENVLGTLENIAIAARPFFDDAVDWIEKWTQGWQTGTRDIGQTRSEIERMVDHLKSIGRLGGAGWDLLRDLLGAGAPSGRGLIDDMTKQLREWDRWVQRNPREVRTFFRETADDTRTIARALSDVVGFLDDMGELLRPILTAVEGITSLISAVGPGAIPLLLGARRGLAGMGGRGPVGGAPIVPVGGGGRPPGAAPPFIPLARDAAREGRAGFRQQYGALRGLGATRTEASRAALFGVRGVGGVAGPTAAAIGTGAVQRGAGLAGGALRGYLPIAALFAGLQGLGTQGNLGQRAQAAASSLTLGLIPQPVLGAEQMETTQGVIEEFAGGLPQGPRAQMRALAARPTVGGGLSEQERAIVAARMDAGESRADALASEGINRQPETTSVARRLADELRDAGVEAEEAWKAATLWSQRARAQLQRQIRGEKGREASTGPFDALEVRLRHGQDLTKAFDKTADDLESRAKDLKGRSRQTFLDMTNEQLRALRRAHPKLRDEIDKTQDDIARRMSRGAGEYKEIQGRIVDTSARQWENIRKKMVDEAALARAQVSIELTRLQRQAVAILRNMGLSPGSARQLVTEMERPGLDKPFSGWEAAATQGGGSSGGGGSGGGGSNRPKNALGGRLRGRSHVLGQQDHVELADGSIGADGELVVNKHTERRIDRLLRGTSLSREVAQEQTPHGAKAPIADDFARGGRMARMLETQMLARGGRGRGRGRRGQGPVGGFPDAMGALPGLDALAWILKQQFGLNVISGSRPGAITTSGNPSDHGWGGAIDVSNGITTPQMDAAARWLAGIGGFPYAPGVMGPGGPIKQMLYRTMIGGDHFNHIHIALMESIARDPSKVMQIFGGGRRGAAMAAAMGMGPAAVQQMRPLKASAPKTRGLIGAAEARGKQMIAAGMTKQINRRLRRMGGMAGGAYGGPTSGALNVGQIEQLAASVGMRNPRLMAAIAMAESSGDTHAHGPPDGRGLWQIEWPIWQGQLGHLGNPYDARANAMMAKEVLKQQGLGAWVVYNSGAYRQYMARGGRTSQTRGMATAGELGNGGDFIAHRPTHFVAGDRGPERIHVSPMGRKSGGAISIGKVEVNMQGANLRSDQDVKQTARKLGREIGDEIVTALKDSRVHEQEVFG